MQGIKFTTSELVAALGILDYEAEYLLSGDAVFNYGEMQILADYKGVSLEAVSEYFRFID